MTQNKFAYSPELDGLRALAVMSVFIYHLDKDLMPGGFLGVDVFFVLSGFLITSIIKNNNHFTFKDLSHFYAKRIKRILPPLYFVLLVVSIAGFFLLTSKDYKNLKLFTERTILFSANIFQMHRDGYFGPKSYELPLLHTWSLSIEEQFYFIWPTIYLLLNRNKNLLLLILIFMIFGSLFYSEYLLTVNNQKTSYLSLFSRSNELLIGVVLTYIPKVKIGHRISLVTLTVSLFVLIASMFTIDQNSSFPGLLSLIPSISTSAIIYVIFNGEFNFVSNVLSAPITNYIGRRSYSIYLWHWPALAFTRYLKSSYSLNIWEVCFCVLTTFGLSHISYKYIETPLQKTKLSLKKSLIKIFLIPSVSIFLVLVISITALRSLTNAQNISTDLDKSHNTGNISSVGNGVKRVLVIGDSNAAHLYSFFGSLSQKTNATYEFLTSGACAPVVYSKSTKTEHSNICAEMQKKYYSIGKNYDLVVVAGRWDNYFDSENYPKSEFRDSLVNTLSYLKTTSNRIILVTQIPLFTDGFNKIDRLLFKPNFQVIDVSKFNEKIRSIASENGAQILDLYRITQLPEFQSTRIHYDSSHLSKEGSSKLGKYFIDNWDPTFGGSDLISLKK